MSVYIPGMEMPKSCSTEACFVRTVSYENGTVWCPVAKGYLGDQATFCPLVPVPPHGRLIDADALRAEVKKHATPSDAWVFSLIRTANTIISAEPPKEEQT